MRFLPVVGVMVLIFVLSHTPGHYLPEPALLGQDKLCHAVAYATLAAATLWAWFPRLRPRPQQGLWRILIFCLLYGASDEFHQSYIPGRYASLADLGADGLGAGLFLLSWWMWYTRQQAGK